MSKAEKHDFCANCQPTKHICKSFKDGLFCSRKRGHAGDHVACLGEEHSVLTWTDEEAEPFNDV